MKYIQQGYRIIASELNIMQNIINTITLTKELQFKNYFIPRTTIKYKVFHTQLRIELKISINHLNFFLCFSHSAR